MAWPLHFLNIKERNDRLGAFKKGVARAQANPSCLLEDPRLTELDPIAKETLDMIDQLEGGATCDEIDDIHDLQPAPFPTLPTEPSTRSR